MALEAPFSLKQPACVPDLHAIPSKKVRCKTRGTFATGADGKGYLLVSPWTNSNDDFGIIASSAALSSTAPLAPGSASTVRFNQTKLPYGSAQFQANASDPGVEARTVGVGVRIRYIGPELARSGQIVGIRDPDNGTLIGKPYTQIRSYSTAKTFRNGRRWIYSLYRPVKPNEYEFSNEPYTDSVSPPPVSASHSLGFIVEGTTDTTGSLGPATFEWEVIRFVEYVGNIDNITATHVDVAGMGHVRNALPSKSSTDSPAHRFKKVVKSLEDSIGESLPAAAAGAIGAKQFLSGGAEAAETAEGGGIFDALGSMLTSAAGEGGLMEGLEMAAPLLLL